QLERRARAIAALLRFDDIGIVELALQPALLRDRAPPRRLHAHGGVPTRRHAAAAATLLLAFTHELNLRGGRPVGTLGLHRGRPGASGPSARPRAGRGRRRAPSARAIAGTPPRG